MNMGKDGILGFESRLGDGFEISSGGGSVGLFPYTLILLLAHAPLIDVS